jgi:hypothetical protein
MTEGPPLASRASSPADPMTDEGHVLPSRSQRLQYLEIDPPAPGSAVPQPAAAATASAHAASAKLVPGKRREFTKLLGGSSSAWNQRRCRRPAARLTAIEADRFDHARHFPCKQKRCATTTDGRSAERAGAQILCYFPDDPAHVSRGVHNRHGRLPAAAASRRATVAREVQRPTRKSAPTAADACSSRQPIGSLLVQCRNGRTYDRLV